MNIFTRSLFIFLMMVVSCGRNEISNLYTPPSIFTAPHNNKIRKSYALTKSLFIEEYYSYQAAPNTQMVTVYLTDSLNFKVVIANFDEHMSYNVNYDSLHDIAIGIGLEYKYKADSVLGVDTINLNKYLISNRIDLALNNFPILGKEFNCKNAEFKNRYKMSRAVWSVPKRFTLTGEDYMCNGNYKRAYYLSDSNCKILLKVDHSNEYFPYVFDAINDSLLLLKRVKSYDIYDTLYRNVFSIDSLINKKRK